MLRRTTAVIIPVIMLISASLAAVGRPAADPQETSEAIRRALVRLPYYGVFDFLAFRYERGTATLSGFAYGGGLKGDAVRVVKRLPGVDSVVDEIEQLPASPGDDRIRWATFHNIYNDAFLSRYAPGGGALTRFDRQFLLRRYPGMQPFGTYPIHIIVNRGRTLLVGTVDSEADRITAGFRAREIPGTFRVENELVLAER